MRDIIYDTGDTVLLKNDTTGKVCYDLRGARAVKVEKGNGVDNLVEITDENPVVEILEKNQYKL